MFMCMLTGYGMTNGITREDQATSGVCSMEMMMAGDLTSCIQGKLLVLIELEG